MKIRDIFTADNSHRIGTMVSVLVLSAALELIELPAINRYSAAQNKKPFFDKIGDQQENKGNLSLNSGEYELVVLEMESSITEKRNIFLAKRFPNYSLVTSELTSVSYYEVFTGKLIFESEDSKDNIYSDKVLSVTDLIFLLDNNQIGKEITIEQAIEIYKKLQNNYMCEQVNYGRR